MAGKRAWLSALLGVMGLMAFVAGCEKKEAAPQAPPAAEPAAEPAADTARPGDSGDATAHTPAGDANAGGITQTKCPTCGGEGIDRTVFVEYKGRKVYFCCKHCVEPFQKDPEKYAANLPAQP